MLLKIYIGMILLKKMKYRLNFFYRRLSKSLIFTIIATILVLTYNTVLNYLVADDFSIFWRYQIYPVQVTAAENLVEFFLVLINVNFEVFLMLYTAGNIDFKNYVYLLFSGYQKLEWFNVASIFIYVNEK